MSDLGKHIGVGPVMFKGVDNAAPVSFVTSDSAACAHEIGTRVTYKGEDYVFVHNTQPNTALAVGDLCVISGLSGLSVTNATILQADMPICGVKHAPIPSAGFGWGITRGIMEALRIENTAGTGVLLGVGSGGVAISLLVGSFPTGAVIGKVLSSGTGTCKAYVKLYG